jgi:hypothetical protein
MQYAPVKAPAFWDSCNVKMFGAVGDGITDDTAEIQAALTYVASVGGTVYFPAGVYKISDNLILNIPLGHKPVKLFGTGVLYHTHATKSCLIVKGSTLAYDNLIVCEIEGLTFAGQGSATTGHLLEDQLAYGLVLRSVSFTGHGGRALQIWGERVIGYSLRFAECRQAIATAAPGLNENYFYDTHVYNCGYAQDLIKPNGESANAYSYNTNSTAGVFPTAAQALIPDQHASITFASAQNILLEGGSIKPMDHQAGIRFIGNMEQTALKHLYIEAFNANAINSSVIYGGLCEKTTSANAITNAVKAVPLTSGKWFLSTTGLADTTAYGIDNAVLPFAIYPPDYITGSGAASSLGGGIVKGDYEFVSGRYIQNDTLFLNSRAFFSTAAKAWPAGAIVSEQIGYTARNTSTPGDLVLLEGLTISSPGTPGAGFTVTHDPDTGAIYGGIVIGNARDIFNDVWESSNGNKGFKFLNSRPRGGASSVYIYSLSRCQVEGLDVNVTTDAHSDPANLKVWQNFIYRYVTYDAGAQTSLSIFTMPIAHIGSYFNGAATAKLFLPEIDKVHTDSLTIGAGGIWIRNIFQSGTALGFVYYNAPLSKVDTIFVGSYYFKLKNPAGLWTYISPNSTQDGIKVSAVEP